MALTLQDNELIEDGHDPRECMRKIYKKNHAYLDPTADIPVWVYNSFVVQKKWKNERQTVYKCSFPPLGWSELISFGAKTADVSRDCSML